MAACADLALAGQVARTHQKLIDRMGRWIGGCGSAPRPREIVRPKISDAAPVTLGSNYAPMGETIALEMGNGLTALASISPFNDTNRSPSLSPTSLAAIARTVPI